MILNDKNHLPMKWNCDLTILFFFLLQRFPLKKLYEFYIEFLQSNSYSSLLEYLIYLRSLIINFVVKMSLTMPYEIILSKNRIPLWTLIWRSEFGQTSSRIFCFSGPLWFEFHLDRLTHWKIVKRISILAYKELWKHSDCWGNWHFVCFSFFLQKKKKKRKWKKEWKSYSWQTLYFLVFLHIYILSAILKK